MAPLIPFQDSSHHFILGDPDGNIFWGKESSFPIMRYLVFGARAMLL